MWVTSSFCSAENGCVEVRMNPPGLVRVRHSRDPDGSKLVFTDEEWAAFIEGVKAGEFDGS